MTEAVFADTFAIVEFLRGNAKFKRFFLEGSIIITKYNLAELYYGLLAELGEKQSDDYYNHFLPCCVDPEDLTIKSAMKLRLKLKKDGKNVSYANCIGYQLSMDLGIKFLTGDREFKGMPNVYFVK